jgi:lipoprotein-anchoring transpeptidase ErfK/SrfK
LTGNLRVAFVATLALAGAASVTAGPGHSAASATVKPSQALAALASVHEAFSRPTASSTKLESVPPNRPLTREQTTLPVLAERTGPGGHKWLRVRLPGRPNGLTGWIKKAHTVALSTPWHIVVDTSSRTVTVYRGGRSVLAAKAVVGKPSTPTPTGQFFVEEDLHLPANAVGAPFALALSARSDVFQDFDGGPGQIALHGLANVGGTPGTAASHGCIRLPGSIMHWLVLRIGPGVPVTIA